MDPRFLLNLVVGALALLGWAVLIIFLVEFREEVTLHPIYRTSEGRVNPPRSAVEGRGIEPPTRRERDEAQLERKRA
jgi:hypothetical protein